MFVGHYAAAFALKGVEKRASLGWLFIATQFVDILFFPFVVMGIENLKFSPGYTQVNDFNMDYYPFTHGLLASIIWALLLFVIVRYFILRKKPFAKKVAMVLAIGVLSHWFTDLLVHTPDLPLVCDEPKLGLGLWNNKLITFVLEALLLILGLLYYLQKTKPLSNSGKYAAPIFVIFLIFVNYLNIYVLPPNHDILSLTISALVAYFLFAGIASYVDKKRS
jgi:hypothetical protein